MNVRKVKYASLWLIFELWCIDIKITDLQVCLPAMTAFLLSTIEIERSIKLTRCSVICSNRRILTCLPCASNFYFTSSAGERFKVSKAFITRMLSPLIPFTAIVLVLKTAVAIPYHGSQRFLGYDYWTRRYPSLGYTDWDGFWNNYYSGRTQYKRASSETSGQECTGCQCDDFMQEIRCFGNPSKL